MAQRFWMGGRTWAPGDEGFQSALGSAVDEEARPLCLCVDGGVPMYVAHHAASWLIKRMPTTAGRHHPSCPSFEPPTGASGIDAHLGRSIRDVGSGLALRLSFGLRPREVVRERVGVVHARGDVPPSPGVRGLSLQGLMHLLFDRAQLNRWSLGRHGRRNQAMLHAHLMAAAQGCWVQGGSLAQRLLIPEPFAKEGMREAAVRRVNRLRALGLDRALVLGEFKSSEVVGERVRLWLRHWPDWPLWASLDVWRRLERAQCTLFEALQASQTLRLVVMAVIEPIRMDTYRVQRLGVMLTTAQWVPLHACEEEPLLEHLVREGRVFIKPLRYDTEAAAFANALLLDAGSEAVPLHVLSPFMTDKARQRKLTVLANRSGEWVWDMTQPMPALPRACDRVPGP